MDGRAAIDQPVVHLLSPEEAQEVFKKHEPEIGVTMVPFSMMVYLEGEDRYIPDDEVKDPD